MADLKATDIDGTLHVEMSSVNYEVYHEGNLDPSSFSSLNEKIKANLSSIIFYLNQAAVRESLSVINYDGVFFDIFQNNTFILNPNNINLSLVTTSSYGTLQSTAKDSNSSFRTGLIDITNYNIVSGLNSVVLSLFYTSSNFDNIVFDVQITDGVNVVNMAKNQLNTEVNCSMLNGKNIEFIFTFNTPTSETFVLNGYSIYLK